MRKRAVEQHWREEDSREFCKGMKDTTARARRRRARQEARAWIHGLSQGKNDFCEFLWQEV